MSHNNSIEMSAPLASKKTKSMAKIIRSLSLGKYQTVFYNEEVGASYNSSIFGGILTLITFGILLLLSVVILTSVLDKDHYNLDNFSMKFETYEASFEYS
jgi:hypothetical protein